MTDALRTIITRPGRAATPQREQADERQSRNHAGGFAFAIPGEARVRRFLTLGTDGGTYYVTERELTAENAGIVIEWAKARPADLAALAAEISGKGVAPKNNPAIFAVMAAMAYGDEAGKHAAEAAFPKVVRTGTHLFTAASYLEQLRGWGPVARRAFSAWYLGKDAGALSYQLVKYRQREGWTHADVLRSAHPKPRSADGSLMTGHDQLFKWATGGGTRDTVLPLWIEAYERARMTEQSGALTAEKTQRYVRLIQDYPGLPWEALPDEATSQPDVWRALIEAGMPVTALMRNLPKLTRLGVIGQMSEHLRLVTDRLTDQQLLIKGRVHPVNVLIALRTYALGHSLRGTSTWTPVQQVAGALDAAFYLAFGAVEPAGRRTMGAVDVSGSMGWPIRDYGSVRGGLLYPFTAAEIAGAMAMVQVKTEPRYGLWGFADQLRELPVSPSMRLDAVMRAMRLNTFGRTDCAAPMIWALRNRVEVDTFQVTTDNETWYGTIHPHQALEAYRQGMGIDARLQVLAVVPTEFSIADADDPRQLDVSGFGSDVPQLLAGHSRGDI